MKKFIAKLLGIVSVFCCAVALFVACGTKKVTYQVQHIYETLSETAETVVIDFTADENSVVEAEVSPKTGYEFDRDNEKNVLSGKASNGLVLKLYYNLMQYNVGQTQTENGSFTTTVSGETKISAKIGQEVLITPSADPGYEVYGVSVTDAAGNSVTITDNKFVMPASDVNVSVVFKPIDTVAYEVKHYIKDLTGDGYTPVTQVYFVKPETTVTAEALADAGYVEDVDHAERVASGTATQETTLVLKLYYDRKSFAVTTDGTLSVSTNKTEAKVGETVEFTVSGDLKQGYHVAATVANATNENETVSIVETKSGFAFAMPSWPVVIKATAAANSDTPYSVEYYGAELGEDGNYQLLTVQKLTGTTDTTVTAEIKTFQGYEEDTDNAARVVSGIVKGDGSSVLKVYYKRMGCTLTFVDLSGVTLKTATVEYGAKGVAEPETDGYVIDDDTIWYWSVNGARYDADNTVWQNTIVEQKLYDKVIRTKEDFYEAFQIKDGVSSAVISGAYILTSDIDFENSGIAIYGFGGLLEGNGYALKNVSLTKAFEGHDTGSYGFFQMMSGTIRNMAFVDFKSTGILYNYTANRIDILCRVGIVASKLNGTLENVYVKGMLKGTVNEMIVNNKGTSWPRDGVVFPYGDAEGEAVGGYLAYDATGAKLKNVIVDVLEQRDGLQHNTMANLTQWRRDSKLHLIAGKGVPDVENVFVVETDAKTYNDYGQYAPATRGFMPAEIGVEYGVLSNSQFSDKLIAAFATTFDIARYVEENASVSPLKNDIATAMFTEYTVEHYYALPDSQEYRMFYQGTYVGKVGETVNATAIINGNYVEQTDNPSRVVSAIVEKDGTTLKLYYTKKALLTSFESLEFDKNYVDTITYTSTDNGTLTVATTSENSYNLQTYFPALTSKLYKGNVTTDGTQALRFIASNPTVMTTISISLTEEQKSAIAGGSGLTFKMLMWSAQSKNYGFSVAGGTFVLDGVATTAYTDTNRYSATWHTITLTDIDPTMETLTVSISNGGVGGNDHFILFIDEIIVDLPLNGEPCTVTLQNGEETTTIRRYLKGSTAEILYTEEYAPTKAGYDFDAWYNGTTKVSATDIISGDVTLTANFTPRTDTPYAIELYCQQSDGTYLLKETLNKEGTTDETITLTEDLLTFIPSGFAFDASNENNILSGVVAADGSLVLKVYTNDLSLRLVSYNVEVKYKYLYTDDYVDVTNLYALNGEAMYGTKLDLTETATANAPAGFTLNTTESKLTVEAMQDSGNEFIFAYEQTVAMISFEDTEMNENNSNKVTWSEDGVQDSKIADKAVFTMKNWGYHGDPYLNTQFGYGTKGLMLSHCAQYNSVTKTYTISLTKQMIEGLKRGGTLSFSYRAVAEAYQVNRAATVNGTAWDLNATNGTGGNLITYTLATTYDETNAPETLTITIPKGNKRTLVYIDDITVTLPSA